MPKGRVPRRIYSPAQRFDISFGSGAVINLFADAHDIEVISALAVGSRVAARCVAHILFTVADCTDTEVFWQEAISALGAIKHQVFENFFFAEKYLVEEAFSFFGAEEFHYRFEYMKADVDLPDNRDWPKPNQQARETGNTNYA
jgi:hypothetical protein